MEPIDQEPIHVEIAQNALLANKQHQHALSLYTGNLEAELQSIDQMLVSLIEINCDTTDSSRRQGIRRGGRRRPGGRRGRIHPNSRLRASGWSYYTFRYAV